MEVLSREPVILDQLARIAHLRGLALVRIDADEGIRDVEMFG